MAASSTRACYVEGSAASTFFADARRANGAIGLGCDTALHGALAGAGIRAQISDNDRRGWSLFARLGVMLNPSLLGYGLLSYGVPEYRLRDDGTLSIGAGIETQIGGQTIFLEASKGIGSLNAGHDWSDEVTLRAGLRFKF